MIHRSRSFLNKIEWKNVCQLEGSDHGGRDSAAELALAGIYFQTPDSSCNRLTLGSALPDARDYTPPKQTVNVFVQRPSLSGFFALSSKDIEPATPSIMVQVSSRRGEMFIERGTRTMALLEGSESRCEALESMNISLISE